MKKNEFKQLTGLSAKELAEKSRQLKKEIADLTMDKNMKKLKDRKSISKKRKELAQVLTVKRQKELLVELESKVKTGKEKQ